MNGLLRLLCRAWLATSWSGSCSSCASWSRKRRLVRASLAAGLGGLTKLLLTASHLLRMLGGEEGWLGRFKGQLFVAK